MCGINGIVSTAESGDVSQILNKMNGEIFHRGPDQDGIFVSKTDGYTIGMGMRRLSIIDLSTGKQPIYSDDEKIAIVFNGEIYNYLELKQDLIFKGVEFNTTSDTEVILKLYEKYGVAAFSMLDGMFAFSIYDDHLKKLFIARDFFGEKPLYYTSDENGFFWASELKSIIAQKKVKPQISREGLNLYFQLTYIPAPFTIYEGIFKLKANHFLEYDFADQKFEENEIKQDFKNEKSDLTFEQAKSRTHTLVQESVQLRSIADVPLGTFLSGGVDSSIVSLCLAQQSAAKIDTFSIGFEKKSFDETDKSRTVAKLINSNHHEFIVSEGDMKENMSSILLNFDEPFADSSSLATYLVANKTRQHVKVALTGDGGDEVFGGYNKYYMGKLNRKYTAVMPESLHSSVDKFASSILSTADDNRGFRFRMRRLLKAVNYEGDFYYNIISLGFQDEELREILRQDHFKADSLKYYKDQIGDRNKTLSDFRNIDRLLSLEGDMLVKVDRTSMLTSLESRAPFLNKEIWNFTSGLPESYLIKGWNKKYLLKESFKQYFPEDFLNKSKQGFGVPVGDWLRGYLKPELKSYIEQEFLSKQGIFNYDEINHLVNRHLEGKEDNTFRVWTFFCFQKWYKSIYIRA